MPGCLNGKKKSSVYATRRVARSAWSSAVPPPEILTLRERLARPRKPTPWRIVDSQVIGHRVILAAQFKAGKTTMKFDVVRSLLDGTPFLDTYDVSPVPGTVAVLDFEMADNQLDDWYRDYRLRMTTVSGSSRCAAVSPVSTSSMTKCDTVGTRPPRAPGDLSGRGLLAADSRCPRIE